jgi:hypothetical protein
MKNKIYYLGIMACIVTTCGCLFKIQHWAGAGILLIAGLAILALAFIPLAIGSLYKAESNKRLRLFYVLTAVIVDINLLAVLFKVMHWPYAGSLLLISFPLPFLVLLPVFLFSSPEEKLINYRHFLAVMFFFGYYASVTALLTLGVSRNITDAYVQSAYNLEEKATVLAENALWILNQSARDTLSGYEQKTDSKMIIAEADKLCAHIDKMKRSLLIQYSGNTSKVFKNGDHADLQAIRFKDSRPEIDWIPVTGLKSEINDFRTMLQKECKAGSSLHSYLNEVLDTRDIQPDGLTWENKLMKDKILVSAIENLNSIQFSIRLAVFEVVSSVQQ